MANQDDQSEYVEYKHKMCSQYTKGSFRETGVESITLNLAMLYLLLELHIHNDIHAYMCVCV